jgi:hypothetical protein
LREWTLKIWQTIFSVVRDSQGKFKGDISTRAPLHEHAFVLGATSTLNAKVDVPRGIDQH